MKLNLEKLLFEISKMNIFNNLLLFQYVYMELSGFIKIFKQKNLKDGVLIHCEKDTTTVNMQKMLFFNNIRINTIKIGSHYNELNNHISRVGIVVATSCNGWDQVINDIVIENKFRYPYYWIFLTDNLPATVNILNDFPIEVHSNAIIVDRTTFYSVYNTGFKKNGKMIVKNIGLKKDGINIIERDNRNDLSGIQLNCVVVILNDVVTVPVEEYLKRDKKKIGIFDSIHRLKYLTLLNYLQEMYNWTYKIQLTDSWGYRHNGSFDGMVGALERNEADIGGSPIFFRSDRNEIIDYTAQVWPSRHSFIFRHPKNPSNFYTLYTRPLSVIVWCCILAMFILSGVLLFFIFKLKMYLEGKVEEDSSLTNSLLTIWSSLCQQGICIKEKASSMKIMIFISLAYTFLIYNYYNGVVVSTLLMEAPKSIKTLKDLLNSNLRVGDEEALYDRDYFERTTDPVAIELYHRKIKNGDKDNFFSPEQGMALVKRGGFAFHVDTIVSYGIVKRTFNDREICEIQEITMYAPHSLGVVMKKGSPYRNHLAYGIRKMMESGLLQRIRWNWDEPRPRCMNIPDTSLFSVSIMEFSTPLTILAFGFIASLIILAFEIIL